MDSNGNRLRDAGTSWELGYFSDLGAESTLSRNSADVKLNLS